MAFAAFAVEHLDRKESAAGFLSAAVGVGGMLGAGLSVTLIGRRRLTPAMVLGAVLLGVPVILLAGISQLWLAFLALGVAGAGYRVTSIAGRTLLQGSTPDDVLARVFGVLEGLNMLSLSMGAMAVFVLERLVGLDATLVIVGALLPIAMLLGARRLLAIGAARPPPDTDLIVLLRSVPIFAPLPAHQIEQLVVNAQRLTPQTGEVVIQEGEPGDRAYVVAAGTVEAWRGDRLLGTKAAGDYFGEVALMRDVPRTATVVADEAVVLCGFERGVFLEAVTGCPLSLAYADDQASRYMDEA